MLQYATVFLIIAIVAAAFGIGAAAAGAMDVAKVLFVLFGGLCVGGLVSRLRSRRSPWASRDFETEERADERAIRAGRHQ